MTENVLLIDQGNTRLKWVLSRNRELLEETAGRGDFHAFSKVCKHGGLESVGTVLLSSVAGSEATLELVDFCKSLWGVDTRVLKSQKQGSGIQNGYAEPGKLGVDRWLAIAGAVDHYGKPVVVWDMGTATTIDAVDENGQHIGGVIYPGPATMLNSLSSETKLQVPPSLSKAELSPGRSTNEAISNGVLATQVGALNQFMHHAAGSLGTSPKLVATGGGAVEIIPLLEFPCTLDPWLVFRGMLAEGIR